jgi:hypothetical protein
LARPDLVFYEVPVELVHFVQGQQVQHLEDEGYRKEVAANIKQDPTPHEARRINHLQAQAQQQGVGLERLPGVWLLLLILPALLSCCNHTLLIANRTGQPLPRCCKKQQDET